MRTVWVDDDGNEFESYEEAYDEARNKMDLTDLADHFRDYVSFEQLLNWALKQNGFWNQFEDAFSQAEQDYFEEWYHEVETEDDDDL